jgi:hypothetical protein
MTANDTVMTRRRRALDRATYDELHHAAANERQLAELASQTAQHGAREKRHDADDQDALATVLIAEFAVDRHGDRRRQHVRRGHPRIHRQPLQLLDDAWHR